MSENDIRDGRLVTFTHMGVSFTGIVEVERDGMVKVRTRTSLLETHRDNCVPVCCIDGAVCSECSAPYSENNAHCKCVSVAVACQKCEYGRDFNAHAEGRCDGLGRCNDC